MWNAWGYVYFSDEKYDQAIQAYEVKPPYKLCFNINQIIFHFIYNISLDNFGPRIILIGYQKHIVKMWAWEYHKDLGAKFVSFAGYEMPVQYEGVTVEHETVRNHVGIFDVSHMGEFLIEGEEAFQLIQKISSNDASKLNIGKAQYSCMPNNSGGIVDDLIIYRIKENTYLLVVNASNIEKDWNWIESQNTFKASQRNLSDDYALLAIQGPKAIESMQSLTSIDLAEIPYYSFKIADFAGLEHVIISATGYTGSGGFEIYFKNDL